MLHNRIWRSVNRRIGTVLNNDDVELDIEKHFRQVFTSGSGEIILRHLLEVSEIDIQKGCVSEREAVYLDGKQDMVKYILSKITPENK